MAMPTGELCWKKNSGAPLDSESNALSTALPRKICEVGFEQLRGAFSNFCPFALKARSTTLIFVECITWVDQEVLKLVAYLHKYMTELH